MKDCQLSAIKALVYQHCGLLLEGVAEERLKKALAWQMQENGLDVSQYIQLINQNTKAFQSLINQLTVNETYFFREHQQIDLLINYLLPKILERKGGLVPVRILSAGCSSGEEPYSLAIAIRETLGEEAAKKVIIDAGDLDTKILLKAQQAIYSDFSFRGVSQQIRNKYFSSHNRGYKLREEISQSVNFMHLNLLATSLTPQLNSYDVIFFRNVSIYFDLATRERIHKLFYNLMHEDAVLFLGSSETLGNNLGVFDLVESQGQYFFVKGQAYKPQSNCNYSNQSLSFLTKVLHSNLETDELRPEPVTKVEPLVVQDIWQVKTLVKPVDLIKPSLDLTSLQQLVADENLDAALHKIEQFLAVEPNLEETQHLQLLQAWCLANKSQFARAQQLINHLLAQQPWHMEFLLLQGLIYKWQGRLEQALDWFKKVTYSKPEAWAGHYFLAASLKDAHLFDAAVKSYMSVKRILQADSEASTGTEILPLGLVNKDIIYICKYQIQQIEQQKAQD